MPEDEIAAGDIRYPRISEVKHHPLCAVHAGEVDGLRWCTCDGKGNLLKPRELGERFTSTGTP